HPRVAALPGPRRARGRGARRTGTGRTGQRRRRGPAPAARRTAQHPPDDPRPVEPLIRAADGHAVGSLVYDLARLLRHADLAAEHLRAARLRLPANLPEYVYSGAGPAPRLLLRRLPRR